MMGGLPAERRMPVLATVLSLLQLCALGCGREAPEGVLARTRDGWVLTRHQLVQEFARVYPKLPFDEATEERRRSFLTDVINNEVLRGVAKAEVPELSWEAQRRLMVAREDWLAGSLFQELVGKVQVSESDRASMLRSLNRAARLQRIVPPGKQQAERCYQA